LIFVLCEAVRVVLSAFLGGISVDCHAAGSCDLVYLGVPHSGRKSDTGHAEVFCLVELLAQNGLQALKKDRLMSFIDCDPVTHFMW
jgi:hypothetical protein